MKLKAKLCALFTMLMILTTYTSVGAYDFWIDTIGPEKDEISEAQAIKINADTEKVREIAMTYSEKYIVRQLDYVDVSVIDEFMDNWSTTLSVKEIDSGAQDGELGDVFDTQASKDFATKFRALSSDCEFQVFFEPTCFFQIYRNVYLVGGYFDYGSSGWIDIDACAYKMAESIQERTREIVGLEQRQLIRKQINDVVWEINNDKGLKVFLLTAPVEYDDAGEVIYNPADLGSKAKIEVFYRYN